jgi:hypothetical protein
LKRLNYDGYFLIEYQGEDDPRTAVTHNIEVLSQLLKEVEKASAAGRQASSS